MNASKLKKQAISAAMAAILALSAASSLTVCAADLPSAFWSENPKYEAAVNAGNYNDVLTYGQNIVDMVKPLPEDEQTIDILGSRLYNMAFAAYHLKNYAKSLECFSDYIPFAEKKGWSDGLIIAKNFVKQLTPTFDVYKATSTEQKYYGAKNEPHGVLIGEVSETPREHDSMVLLYIEYGDSNYNWPKVVFDKARANHQTVELALNFPNEGDTARSVSASDSFLTSLRDFVSGYEDVPVLLRIGAEMNIWGSACTPDEFKNAFNAISSVMRTLPNVATVWSVAHTSDWTRTASDFYPGDENVDWVGVTAYPTKFFSGKRWDGDSVFNEVVFKTGYNADPVLEVKEIIDRFGDRKPIMISECGSAYFTGGEINENYIDWSVEQLKNLYGLIPMVYPQVKLMAYFNTRVPNEMNYYDYNNCTELGEAYASIKTSPWFIQDANTNSARMYFEKVYDTINTNGAVTLGSYPRVYGADTITVDYYIDDVWAATSREAPYKVDLTVPDGSHTLKVVATGNNGTVNEKKYAIIGSGEPDSVTGFTDTANLSDVQRNAVKGTVDKGIVNGYEDSTFRPMNTITRAEFATMICRMMGYSSDGKCGFADAADHWATGYIRACVDAGAISGIGDNKFAPNDNVTLEQAVKIITVVTGIASPDAVYPDGFLEAGKDSGIMENLVSNEPAGALNRIDAAMIITQALAAK